MYDLDNVNGKYSGVAIGNGTVVHETCLLQTGDITDLGVIATDEAVTGFLPAPTFNPYAWDDPEPASFHPLDVTAWGPNGTAAAFVWDGSAGQDDLHPFEGNYIFGVGVGTLINGDYNGPEIKSWNAPQFPEPSPFGVIAVVNDNNEFVLQDNDDFIRQDGPDGKYIYYAGAFEVGDLRTKLFLDIYQNQIAYGSSSQMISLTNSGKMLLRMDLIQPVPGINASQESPQLFIADHTIDPSNPTAIKKDLKIVGVPESWNILFPLTPPAVLNGHGATHDQITEQNVIDAIGVRVKDDAGNPLWNQPQRPVLLFPVELAVDGNRDGTINLGSVADQTTTSRPYRFWVNDDQDSTVTLAAGVSGGATDGDVVPAGTPDFTEPLIRCKRDLEDWTRLWINVSGSAAFIKGLVQSGYSVGLQFEAIPGDTIDPLPQIKICKAAESTGATGYTTDDATAAQQIAPPYCIPIADANGNTLIGSAPFLLPSTFWNDVNDTTSKHLLFEGCAGGKGKLKLVFYDSQGNKIGEGGAVYLDIKNIKKMYQRGYSVAGNYNPPYNYTANPLGPAIALATDPNAAQAFDQPWDETSQCIVFVHGFNTTYEQSTNSAETIFKRLWWRGYKGRFASFRWPTYGNGTVPWGALGTYNDSEYMAWHSGSALKAFVSSMPGALTVNIVAHSMGNLVAGEALREGMNANHYAMLHAATSASCYSNNSFTYQATNFGPTMDTDGNLSIRNIAYTGWLGHISGKPINFADNQDSVVGSIWNGNNSSFKPQVTLLGYKCGYTYPGLVRSKDPEFDDESQITDPPMNAWDSFVFLRYVTDDREAKAYVDHSLTGAIGYNETQGGAVVDFVDDQRFGDSHSTEWDWDIQDLQLFYRTLMQKLGQDQNP